MEATTAPVPALESLKNQLEVIQKRDMARLGDGSMFWITEAGQEKRGFKAKVELDYPHHFCFPAGANQKPMITGEGFDRINQFAGIDIFRPKTVIVSDGQERGNPYFQLDPKTGAMLSVFMRGIGIGYGPTGNLVAVDQTVFLNLQTMLVQEVQSKLKKHPQLGVVGTAADKPTLISFYKVTRKQVDGDWQNFTDAEPSEIQVRGAWTYIALTDQIGYWVNVSHPEIMAAFDSYSQKQRFLERTAFTILKRLILSAHPAIACKTPVVTEKIVGRYAKVDKAKAHVVVYGFRQEGGTGEGKRREMEGLADRLAAGERMGNMEIIKPATSDAGEDAHDFTEDADPTEVIPETADEQFEEEGSRPPSQAVAPVVAEADAKARINAMLQDKDVNREAFAGALKWVGVTAREIRTAAPEKQEAFLTAYDKAAKLGVRP